ncbi:NACHT domain-containing protein [Frigoriflavimonas asaccharolytica]|uniref:Adenylate kinase n=1 Tax=Frigoriflavimonas asaccharolytica TaxID=2735899 RepID=A0A8J8G9J0_9FLAO|nr:NACHT domain-containing protein [Frigoriflavimonas asaccharolytica]NRS91462.1 adenylate kinase [Frigoriflavimonas asaccharolytica]
MPIAEFLLKTTLGSLIKEGINSLKRILENTKIELVVTNSDLEEAIYNHNQFVINSTKSVSFKDLKGSKSLSDIYIELDIQLEARSRKSKEENDEKQNIEKILTSNHNNQHIVILGGPGAGKTTTVKHICQLVLYTEIEINYCLPILINLRDINDSESIYSVLKSILGIEVFSKEKDKTLNVDDILLRDKYINSYLNSLKAILILDGFDEVKPTRIAKFYKEIESLMANLSTTLVILTSRSPSYNYNIENSLEYEICDLSHDQITDFTKKWFINSGNSTTFIEELNNSKFYDLSLKPLTLAHLCAIYERTGKFYDKPRSIYKKLIRILIEEWDEQRGIVRESQYSNFDNEQKFEFLTQFAYTLTINYSQKKYNEDIFLDTYNLICSDFNLLSSESRKVIKEIESHIGIIIKSSYDSFEFVHKSMQEYLSAEYIVKLPEIPVKLFYDTNISNELAIAVSLSSKPNEYYYKLVFELFTKENLSKQFILEFLSRLLYEKPNFKDNILIPFSFIYILNLLSDHIYDENNNVENEFISTFNIVVQNYFDDKDFKLSFRKLLLHIEDDEFHAVPNEDDGDACYLLFADSFAVEFSQETLYIVDVTQRFKIPFQYFNKFIYY